MAGRWLKAAAREHLLVGGGADIDAPRVTSRLELARQGDIISKQAVSWHSYPHDSSQHRARVNAYPHLKKKERKRIYIYAFVWYAIILTRHTASYANC